MSVYPLLGVYTLRFIYDYPCSLTNICLINKMCHCCFHWVMNLPFIEMETFVHHLLLQSCTCVNIFKLPKKVDVVSKHADFISTLWNLHWLVSKKHNINFQKFVYLFKKVKSLTKENFCRIFFSTVSLQVGDQKKRNDASSNKPEEYFKTSTLYGSI